MKGINGHTHSMSPLLVAVTLALAPKAFAGFEVIENVDAPVPYVSVVADDRQGVAQMQQTIGALRQEIESLRVRLAAAEADSLGSRQELLAIRARQDQIQETINQMTIKFAFGRAGFTPEPQQAAALVSAAKAAQRIRIFGYTDSVGALEANRRIAELRAEAAKMYLVQQGVAENKISAEGRTGHYIAPNTSAAGRAENRRVEFEFLK